MSQKCLTLPNENFAKLILEKNQKPPFNINDTVKYECNRGYIFSNTSILISKQYPVFTCKLQNNQTIWDFDKTACKPVNCGYPGFVENAYMIGNEFFFPKEIVYKCYEGYTSNSLSSIFCTPSGEWSPSVNKITCKPIFCPNLQVPFNGSIKYSNENKYNSEATYTCDRGFRLLGNKTRTCNNLGDWTGKNPTCEKITCKNPNPNSKLNNDKELYDVGDLYLYFCPTTQKTILAKCNDDGQWTTTINCTNDYNNNDSNNTINPNSNINEMNNINFNNNVDPKNNTSLNNNVDPNKKNKNDKNMNLNSMISLNNNTSTNDKLISNNNKLNNNAGNSINNVVSNKTINPINNIVKNSKKNILKNKIIYAMICILTIILSFIIFKKLKES